MNSQATPSQPVNSGEKMGDWKEHFYSYNQSHTIFASLALQFQKGRHPYPEKNETLGERLSLSFL